MQIENVAIESLKHPDYNPRLWTDKAKQDVKESLKKFGFVEPCVINTAEGRENIIIGGNLRQEMAKELGFTEIPVVKVSIADLKTEQELNLRLNKNTGTWDNELLKAFNADWLKEIGWSDAELSFIFDDKNFDAMPKDSQPNLSELNKITCPNCGHQFSPNEDEDNEETEA